MSKVKINMWGPSQIDTEKLLSKELPTLLRTTLLRREEIKLNSHQDNKNLNKLFVIRNHVFDWYNKTIKIYTLYLYRDTQKSQMCYCCQNNFWKKKAEKKNRTEKIKKTTEFFEGLVKITRKHPLYSRTRRHTTTYTFYLASPKNIDIQLCHFY